MVPIANRIAPEPALDGAPREKVGVDDLVGITAEQEMTGLTQCAQDQRELRTGQILYLVDDNKVVARRGQCLPFLRDQVAVVEPALRKPGAVLDEQVMHSSAMFSGEDRLTRPQRNVRLARQCAFGFAANHAAEFFETLVRIGEAVALAVTREPVAERGKTDLAPGRHLECFEKLAPGKNSASCVGFS